MNQSLATMTVIGVYLPCLEQGIECYKQHLQELERVICESLLLGGVVVLGDFNAHLGVLGGERSVGSPNLQGILIEEGMAQYHLNAVSLGSLSSGSSYTC